MKTFLDLVKSRQSNRSYIDQAIEPEKIERILETARMAPSACNAQPWKFIVVSDKETREKIANATSPKAVPINHFSKKAPMQIIIVEEKANFMSSFGSWTKQKEYKQLDLGIVAAHICLAATEEGLGSCMIGWFTESKIQEALNIPKNKNVVLVITLGYSNDKARNKKRKKMEDIVAYEKYNRD